MNSTFTKILRFVLALALLVFGSNKLFSYIPIFDMPPAAANFMDSLEATGYVLYVVAILEIVIGILLLFNKWVPFALLLLAVSDIWVAIVVVVINIILIYKYWKSYRPLFQY